MAGIADCSNWFSAAVQRRRRELKLSAPKLAVDSGVHENTIYRIEEGGMPCLSTAVRLAVALEIDLNPPDYVVQQLNG